ncbi:hypothetical protein AAMO2058_001279200 [Amorphochlora amoebiformis]
MSLFLIWRGRRVDLTGRTVTVGRRGRNDVVIRGDPFVSKSHCIITDGALRDTSKNGTRVNGSRVEQHSLNPGDCIRIGNAVLEVHGPQDLPTISGNVGPSHQCENTDYVNKRIQRRAQTEQKVDCMIDLLTAFSNSKTSSSSSCRNQDRCFAKKDDARAPKSKNSKTTLRMRLLQAMQTERRNRVSFYRRTMRHLRRTERLRKRLARSWESKFENDE